MCPLAKQAFSEVKISAHFQPSSALLGDRIEYTITIAESDANKLPEAGSVTSLPVPPVDDLKLENGRTSSGSQTRIINGRAAYTRTMSLIFDARPKAAGTYTVPSFQFVYKGETLQVAATTLKVSDRPAGAPPSVDEMVFLRVDAPERLFVGEESQIYLQLFVHEKASLNGLGSFERQADGFTMADQLPDNFRGNTVVNGQRYSVLQWPLTITPIQSGEQSLNFQFNVSVRLPPTNTGRRGRSNGPGGFRSLFDEISGRSEQFTVYSQPLAIDVRPLPVEGQPKSFTGAIGDFSLEVAVDNEVSALGDPIMLTTEIIGKGNFERVQTPLLQETEGWKSYEPQRNLIPNTSISDGTNTLRLDYILTPTEVGDREVPSFEFSYFDPKEERYVRLPSPDITVTIEPPATVFSSIDSTGSASDPASPAISPAIELPLEEELFLLDYQFTKPNQLSSLITHPSVLVTANCLGFITLIFVMSGAYHRLRQERDPVFRRRLALQAEVNAAKDEAAAASDLETFYRQAQKAAAKQRLISSDTVDPNLQQLLARADAYRFSTDSDKAQLSDEKNLLRTYLK